MSGRSGALTRLTRVGWAAGRGSPGAGLRFIALAVAAAVLAGTALLVAGSMAAYAERERRDAVRGPVFTEEDQRAVADWAFSYDTTAAGQHTIVWLRPRDTSTSAPPGLNRWPKPGEVFLSRALDRAGASEHIQNRYGTYVGEIGINGLGSVAERFAIVGMSPHWRGGDLYKISGFGGPFSFGEGQDTPALPIYLLTIFVLLGSGSILLLVVSARVTCAGRDRRLRLLEAIGGGAWHRLTFNLAESALPIGIGASLAAAGYAWILTTGFTVPVTGYAVSANDLRAHLPLAVVADVAAVVASLLAVAALNRAPASRRASRPLSVTAGRVAGWRIGLLCIGLALTVLPTYLQGALRDVAMYFMLIGMVLTWWMLPSLIAAGLRKGGSRLADLGRRGSAALIIAGRWAQTHPGPIIRLTATVIIGLGLLTQVQVASSNMSGPKAEAALFKSQHGDSLLQVRPTQNSPSQQRAFLAALPTNIGVFEVYDGDVNAEPGKRSITWVRTECRTARSLGLPCSDLGRLWKTGDGRRPAPTLRALALPAKGGEVRLTTAQGSRLGELTNTLIHNPDPATMPGWQLKQISYRTLGVPAQAVGQEWLNAAQLSATQGTWLVLLGGTGIIIVLLAGLFSGLAEYSAFAAALSPISVLTGTPRIFIRVSLLTLTMPIFVTALTGALLAYWQALYSTSVTAFGTFSWWVFAAGLGTSALLSLVLGLVGGRMLSLRALRWRPGTA